MFEDVKVGDDLAVMSCRAIGRRPYEVVEVIRVTKTALFVTGWGGGETRWYRSDGYMYGSSSDPYRRPRLSGDSEDLVKAIRHHKEDKFDKLCAYCSQHSNALSDQELGDALDQLKVLKVQLVAREKKGNEGSK